MSEAKWILGHSASPIRIAVSPLRRPRMLRARRCARRVFWGGLFQRQSSQENWAIPPPLKPIAVTTKRTERKSSRRIGGGARRGENLACEVLALGRWALAMFAPKRRRCERLPVVVGCLLGIDNNIAPDPDCGCGCWYRNRITVVPATLAACQKKSR